MQDKRKRILKMLEDGSISMDEALTLLEQLQKDNEGSSSTEQAEKAPVTPLVPEAPKQQQSSESTTDDTSQEGSSKQSKKESSIDDFLEELRKDFSTVGDRFMQFMQTAVEKVKDMDFEAPFGKSFIFKHQVERPSEGVEQLTVNISNGNVTLHEAEGTSIQASFSIKGYHSQEDEETAKKEILDKLIFALDDEHLHISSDMKLVQVHLDLYIPKKQYRSLKVKLVNGSFQADQLDMKEIGVKSTNGKINLTKSTAEKVEVETVNGQIYLNDITAEKVETETLNGRIYVDGEIVQVEAQSLNGNIALTTKSPKAKGIDAKTMSGSVELYIPSTLGLQGQIISSIGKLNLKLDDIQTIAEQEQFLQRSIRFKKDVPDSSSGALQVKGESKTGTVHVYYNV